jgi:hypothetical protein
MGGVRWAPRPRLGPCETAGRDRRLSYLATHCVPHDSRRAAHETCGGLVEWWHGTRPHGDIGDAQLLSQCCVSAVHGCPGPIDELSDDGRTVGCVSSESTRGGSNGRMLRICMSLCVCVECAFIRLPQNPFAPSGVS